MYRWEYVMNRPQRIFYRLVLWIEYRQYDLLLPFDWWDYVLFVLELPLYWSGAFREEVTVPIHPRKLT